MPLADKWVHFLMFGIFAFLWLCTRPAPRLKELLPVLLLTAAFGYLIELLQRVLPFLNRSFDHYDVLADTIGGTLGILLFLLLRPLLAREK